MSSRFAVAAAFVAASASLVVTPAAALSLGAAFAGATVQLVSDPPQGVDVGFDAQRFAEFTDPAGGNEVLSTRSLLDADDVDRFLTL